MSRGIALTLATVLAFSLSGAAALSATLDGNVDRVDIGGLVGAAPSSTAAPNPDDPNAGSPVNILLLGSDQRDGENAEIAGADSSMASDTTIVLHLSADRTRAELVSIPRDSMVRMPACTFSDGSSSKPRSRAQFNEAFAVGWNGGGDIASAAACVMSTVQENTAVTLNHVAVVDMAGFQRMVDAIGGVDICVPQAMQDTYTGLDLAAGVQHLDGVTALQFARARHVKGTDGSDLTRIGSQQRLISAMVNQVLSTDTLTNVPQLISFLSAATSSLTTDEGLTIPVLTGLAYNARNIGAGSITFMTIPVTADPQDPNRVVWTSEADAIWANMAQDLPLIADETPAAVATTAPPAESAPPAETGPAPAGTPTPVETKEAGREAFTADDVTAVCA